MTPSALRKRDRQRKREVKRNEVSLGYDTERILIGWLQPSGLSSDELISASLLIGEITELL
ncbi:unnamed protein product [Leuciscus chuanchicus]